MPFSTKRAAVSHIRWWAIGLVTGTMALLAGPPAALASRLPAYGGESAPTSPAGVAVTGGTPGWQIVLIAIGSALLACALTLLAVHIGRRTPQAQAAAH